MMELEFEQLELFAEVTYTDDVTGETKNATGWIFDPEEDSDVLEALDVPESAGTFHIMFTDYISPFKIPSLINSTVYEVVSALKGVGHDLEILVHDYLDYTGDEASRLLTEDELYEQVISSATPEEAFRLGRFADINHSDTYFKFNGYGNIVGMDDYEAKRHLYDLVADCLKEI